MRFEQPGNITEINKERAASDEKKIKEGAEFKGGRLEFTEEQIKEAKMDMVKSFRESGDDDKLLAAISVEHDTLSDWETSFLLNEAFRHLPEKLRNEVDGIIKEMDDGNTNHVEALKKIRRLLKPALFSLFDPDKNETLRIISKILKDQRSQRKAELKDEELQLLKRRK